METIDVSPCLHCISMAIDTFLYMSQYHIVDIFPIKSYLNQSQNLSDKIGHQMAYLSCFFRPNFTPLIDHIFIFSMLQFDIISL